MRQRLALATFVCALAFQGVRGEGLEAITIEIKQAEASASRLDDLHSINSASTDNVHHAKGWTENGESTEEKAEIRSPFLHKKIETKEAIVDHAKQVGNEWDAKCDCENSHAGGYILENFSKLGNDLELGTHVWTGKIEKAKEGLEQLKKIEEGLGIHAEWNGEKREKNILEKIFDVEKNGLELAQKGAKAVAEKVEETIDELEKSVKEAIDELKKSGEECVKATSEVDHLQEAADSLPLHPELGLHFGLHNKADSGQQ